MPRKSVFETYIKPNQFEEMKRKLNGVLNLAKKNRKNIGPNDSVKFYFLSKTGEDWGNRIDGFFLGLEPQVGFFHRPKNLRSLLVLDVMEMFRSWVVDDLVLKVIWNGDIVWEDFIIERHSQTPVLLTEDGLRKFIDKYYKFVFKKFTDDYVLTGEEWAKLKFVEKTLEEFKKSLVDENFEYKGFLLK